MYIHNYTLQMNIILTNKKLARKQYNYSNTYYNAGLDAFYAICLPGKTDLTYSTFPGTCMGHTTTDHH